MVLARARAMGSDPPPIADAKGRIPPLRLSGAKRHRITRCTSSTGIDQAATSSTRQMPSVLVDEKIPSRCTEAGQQLDKRLTVIGLL